MKIGSVVLKISWAKTKKIKTGVKYSGLYLDFYGETCFKKNFGIDNVEERIRVRQE